MARRSHQCGLSAGSLNSLHPVFETGQNLRQQLSAVDHRIAYLFKSYRGVGSFGGRSTSANVEAHAHDNGLEPVPDHD